MLDDFLFVGSPHSKDCLFAFFKFIEMCNFFGVPLAIEKNVFPSLKIEFLGIVIDSINMEFLLPDTKIVRIRNLLQTLLLAKKSTLRELQSLLGLLVFTSRVIPMDRAFCRRLYRINMWLKNRQVLIFALPKTLKLISIFGYNSFNTTMAVAFGKKNLSLLILLTS